MTKKITIHTLGPTGTNCEKAASKWFADNNIEGDIVLHQTLEIAVKTIENSDTDLLLGCAVYPDLHNIVFENLPRLKLIDSFIMPTIEMVLASRGQETLATFATHPAPRSLVSHLAPVFVNSNAAAALACAAGEADACITTAVAAEANNLTVLENFGPVPMCFTIHSTHNFQPNYRELN
ncbi:hypothetical protein NI389_18135 (plasmid) [Pseudoalteromonas xiamenensis]|uniref:hypothetical protein n=1 Tax=Pseudoalteromonas xiamenensis TaxID=882626 RepID=UPI0027E49E29|nr:hypothetical protein [Pseudoalteromonas xiamenensis]WMN61730.1 hypothetical protein NI389_18135 [Pseudoalteromonas xiamenensis]